MTQKMLNQNSKILVTGASGYIASWLVRYLLEEGYTVHATVRNLQKASSVQHLKELADGQPGTLKLFQADLMKEGSFEEAMQGCEVVMHTASPFLLDGYKDANEALVRPAVEGTRNVLETVNRVESVQRIVLTSSVVAVFGDAQDAKDLPDNLLTEDHWNTTSSVDHQPYNYSKVAAEREAWKIQKNQSRWDLVTINPGMVYGPALTTLSQSASIDTLVSFGDGRLKSGVPDVVTAFVDVRDVAKAHILAASNPNAAGRYLLVAGEVTLLEMAKKLRSHFGDKYPFPKMQVPKWLVWTIGPIMGPITRKFVSRNVGHPIRFDNTRSQELGVKYHNINDTLIEHFNQAIADGLLTSKA